MKKIAGIIYLCLITASSAAAGEVIQTVTFSPINLSISQTKGYDVLQYDYYPNYDAITGNPALPELPLYIVIPPSATVTGVEVLAVDEEIIEGKYLIMPVQEKRPWSVAIKPPFIGPNKDIYSSNKVWPRHIVEYRFTGTKSGFRIATFRIYPIRYIPAARRLIFCTNLKLKITYEEGRIMPLRRTECQIGQHVRDLVNLVKNTDDIVRFSPPLRQVGNVGSMFLPPGEYQEVILTPTAYKDTFQIFADWRTKQGIPSIVFCVESTNVYPGRDIAEQMRSFLRDADTTWGINFAFIARQDHPTLHYRNCWVENASYQESLPCDLYFSDLYRSDPSIPYDWDGNQNGIFGEVDDTIDYWADIFVGMITLDDLVQASIWIRKILLQETAPETTSFAKALLVGAAGVGEDFLNNIYDALTIPPWVGDKMYGSGNGHETPTAAKFRDSINANWTYSAIVAHGNVNSIMIPDNYTATHVGQQTNTNALHTIIAVCCHPGAFHKADECLAETMAVANAGFSNVIMNASYGWVGVAGYYDELFFYKFLPEKVGTPCCNLEYVGQCLSEVKDELTYKYPLPGEPENAWKWESFEKNLFGEPHFVMHNWSPIRTMAVQHDPTIQIGPQNFTVLVNVNYDAPVESVLVCVWKGSEVYEYGLTDPSGGITFFINPTTPGEMSVTCTKRNHLRYEGTVTVTTSISEPGHAPNTPICFALGRSKPNPFSSKSTISYQLPHSVHTKLMIYDISGRKVRMLVNKEEDAGYYSVAWDGKNSNGQECASGIYFYRLEAGEFTATKNLVIMR